MYSYFNGGGHIGITSSDLIRGKKSNLQHNRSNRRNFLKQAVLDRRPDAPLYASDHTTHSDIMRNNMINLYEFGNIQGLDVHSVAHPEAFNGFMDKDPRGFDINPRFEELRQYDVMHAKQNEPRYGKSVGMAYGEQIFDKPIYGTELEEKKIEMYNQNGRRAKIFKDSKVEEPTHRHVVGFYRDNTFGRLPFDGMGNSKKTHNTRNADMTYRSNMVDRMVSDGPKPDSRMVYNKLAKEITNPKLNQISDQLMSDSDKELIYKYNTVQTILNNVLKKSTNDQIFGTGATNMMNASKTHDVARNLQGINDSVRSKSTVMSNNMHKTEEIQKHILTNILNDEVFQTSFLNANKASKRNLPVKLMGSTDATVRNQYIQTPNGYVYQTNRAAPMAYIDMPNGYQAYTNTNQYNVQPEVMLNPSAYQNTDQRYAATSMNTPNVMGQNKLNSVTQLNGYVTPDALKNKSVYVAPANHNRFRSDSNNLQQNYIL